MIDTVVLRLHDLRKYDVAIKRLRLRKNKGFMVKTAMIDIEEAQRLRNAGFRKPKQYLNIMEINRTGEFLVKTEVSKQVNSSGHYAFTYRVDHTNDYIEFNFSIPKYKFGTNVLMFVEHLLDKNFKYSQNRTLIHNMRRALSTFKSFIEYFLRSEFTLDNIDLRDLEVNRIDVCYNLVFNSKADAISYFNYLKRHNKKYSREEDGGKTDYNTSFMYSTKRSSSKVYHKGTEYRKHDLKEHLKINNEKGFEYFKTQKFQEFADRMLRYEVTLRASELNYLFKHKLFRKNCPIFQNLYETYLKVENKDSSNRRKSKKIGSLPEKEKENYRIDHPYEKVNPNERSIHKEISQLINRKPYFMMKIDEADKRYNELTVDGTSNRAEFSTDLLWLCLMKLHDFINEFKMSELPDEDEVGASIDKHNLSSKEKMVKSSMIEFYRLLVEHGSFKEATKFAGKDKSTMHRFIIKFKKIGITENHVYPAKNTSLPAPVFDFNEYHSYLLTNNLLRNIKIK